MVLRLDDGRQVFVPPDALIAQRDGSYYLPLSFDDLEPARPVRPGRGREPVIIPVFEETLDVRRRKVETGRVRISKTVREREEVVDEPFLRHEVEIERVPIDRFVDDPVPPRYEGNTLVIPVLEEVLVVEKRVRLKEEVRVTRVQVESSEPQTVTLRSEELTVERLDALKRE
ncbi:MAG TPA: YsnF/AvaK domain-containing protein [Blastocatellia bacterium]|nr:YsnF/AvaK domain-containing protein [Blastocatellia bacterium]